ncbi:MAG: heme exporter protein CcmB [Acidiphilium sp. 37-64-53]|uniref:heme exporter protein CcmB n=1 Tax=Acidiphilium TaxID=522 RepID=UPI000BDB3CBB|nr:MULTISPECIES: heme exporter protein CcmB [Acidiphilium]MCW8305909.1 heme exporter protein CcmB [Acidiphilium sp. PA]OYW02878.1 MAG: heme exporter protein CcmB [Acidiphilium sp. 37-64-53]OZB28768.1 MAG: heme exporter protein CcmB [Acidiphilium sp. 34-64-41]HQT84699.1 heme exporter protein CcmB [Acidiphilium rubrum]
MSRFLALIRRELILALRHAGDSVASLLFFIIAASLFAFAVGPSPAVLSGIAPGVIWVIALLAALLPLNRLFAADYEDGGLDQLMVSGLPASAVAFGKIIGHWLTTGLPLLIIAGPVAIMLRLDAGGVPQLLLTLLPGTILLSLVGGMSAAITLGARGGTVLLPLIALPLMIPALIFGAAGAVTPHPIAEFAMLLGLLALFLPLAPLAAGAALRAAVS